MDRKPPSKKNKDDEKRKAYEERATDPGVFIVGEQVIDDAEGEKLGTNPLIWMPSFDKDEKK